MRRSVSVMRGLAGLTSGDGGLLKFSIQSAPDGNARDNADGGAMADDRVGCTMAWDASAAQAIIARHLVLEGPMLPILHALQEQFGHVPPQAAAAIAEALNLSQAEVVGTIGFYRDFRPAAPPARVVKLCRAEACQALDCEGVIDQFARRHGIRPDRPTAELALETVYCLGNCALGPSAMVDGALFGRLDADRLAELCGLNADGGV
jgi:formate dehydrogenase subunit gamma